MAPDTAPLPADAFYEYTAILDIATSPNGERVAFVATESDEREDERRRSVFVAPTDGTDEPYRLTRASDAGSPQWSPDGSKLAITAAREQDTELAVEPSDDADEEDAADGNGDDGEGGDGNGGGDDGPESQVWVFDLVRGGDARQITDRSEGVTGFDWGPDGDRIVVAAPDPTDEEEGYQEQVDDDGPIEIERLQHKVNGSGWTDTVTTYLFVVDIESREETRLDRANDGEMGSRRPLAPAWSPDGDRIAFTAYLGDDPDDTMALDLYTIRPDGTGRERLTDADRRLQAPTWSPDGDRIAFVGGDPTNWYIPSEVFVADAASGEDHSVSASLDRTVAWGGGPQWIDEDTLLALIADEGNSVPVRLDADADDPAWLAPWQGDDRAIRALDTSDDGEQAAVLVSEPSAADVYALNVADFGTIDGHASADDDPLDRVTTANEGLLDEGQVPGFERVTWEDSDGIEIEGLVYLPSGFDPDDPDARPVVASVHGGPMSYDAPAFGFDTPYWTSRGYVVLRPNYRGSTSYGREFSERLRGTRGEKEVDDVVSGVDHLVERGWADGDRAFVTGFSYGGITTAATVTSTDRFAAAAAEHGIYDFYSVFGTDDNHNWHEDEFGLPWENPEAYRELSSLTDVGEIDTPLLVTAGERDWRCPPTQAEQLHVSVKKQGVDSKLVIYQDEHHNIGDPDRAIHRIEALTDWFDDHDPGTE
ncbi:MULTISPECIES: S9 family peptidase [Halococcus]|uniref:Dipeptidyl aminopeptidase/acylaminoacyl peptidase n=1 Tax=Halococcus salifodinae DSM 8989 TaxID=1227456 RepID=M0MV27_9EURY|nr:MULTISPECIES: S9 family peptidase [Halococcus]EMA49183.1 dipeptidyl aminopeptidase/acylaminoacyl peptidase [Halococcus salifodinae DSM 8989]